MGIDYPGGSCGDYYPADPSNYNQMYSMGYSELNITNNNDFCKDELDHLLNTNCGPNLTNTSHISKPIVQPNMSSFSSKQKFKVTQPSTSESQSKSNATAAAVSTSFSSKPIA